MVEQKTFIMYINEVKSQDQALCHLFFHCCFKDGEFNDPEKTDVSERLVEAGLYKHLNFKEEIQKYQSYKSEIFDEDAYLDFLIKMITPVNGIALYSYCVELVFSDSSLSQGEENLLEKIAGILEVNDSEQAIIKKLMAQRKVVKTEKIF